MVTSASQFSKKEGRKGIPPVEAMRVLMDEEVSKLPKCSKVPLRVRENKTFLMNTSCFKHWEDIKSDMNGSYNHTLRRSTWTVEIKKDLLSDSYTTGECNVVCRKSLELKSERQFHLKFNSKKNSAGLCRSIVLLFDKTGGVVNNVCLLQYHISTGEDAVDFEVTSHGSSKQKKPFFPCKESLLNEIKSRVSKQPSRMVYENIRAESGGPSKVSNIGKLSRSMQQVYSMSHLHKLSTDSIDELLKYAKKKKQEKVVISHHDFPEDLWLLGTEQMSKDLSRFCTSDLLSYPALKCRPYLFIWQI